MRFKTLIIAVSVLYSLTCNAQKEKDRSGFTYGFGVGAGWASGKNAMFYNGSDGTQNAVKNITENPVEAIGSSSGSTQSQLYNVIRDTILKYIFPTKMTYNPAITLQGYLAFVLENKNSVFAQITYSSLSTNGVFSMVLSSPDTSKFNSANKIIEGAIKAKENRVD